MTGRERIGTAYSSPVASSACTMSSQNGLLETCDRRRREAFEYANALQNCAIHSLYDARPSFWRVAEFQLVRSRECTRMIQLTMYLTSISDLRL